MGEVVPLRPPELRMHARVRLAISGGPVFTYLDRGTVLAIEPRGDELEPRVYVSWDLGVNHRRRAWHPPSDLQVLA